MSSYGNTNLIAENISIKNLFAIDQYNNAVTTAGLAYVTSSNGQMYLEPVSGVSTNYWSGSLTGDIYNLNTGNVGVGVITPTKHLQVSTLTTDGLNGIAAKSSNVDTILGAYSQDFLSSVNAGSLQVIAVSSSVNVPYTLAINPLGGVVHIGSTSYNVNLRGTTYAKNNLFVNGDIIGYSTLNVSSIKDGTNSTGSNGQVLTAGTGGQVVWSTVGSDVFWQSSSSGIYNTNSGGLGFVGIGTSSPTQLLTVSGNALITSTLITSTLQVSSIRDKDDSAGSSGQFLSVDSAGQVVWSTITNGGGTDYWLANGNDIYNSNAGNVGIGISTPQASLHINTPSVSTFTYIFTSTNTDVNGRGTFTIPANTQSITFQVLGSGGYGGGATWAGTGGYLSGYFEASTISSHLNSTVTVQVGKLSGSNPQDNNTASFIAILSGAMFVTAGSGGNVGSNTVAGRYGGSGGGGTFSGAGVANGTDASDVGGKGGTSAGGAGGVSPPGLGADGNAGVNSGSGAYLIASGGTSALYTGSYSGAGGAGWAGGGSGAVVGAAGYSGGGGSSAYNNVLGDSVIITTSYDGSTLYSAHPSLLQGYGRPDQNGYVIITLTASGTFDVPSLVTNGYVGIGTTTPNYPLEVALAGTLETFSTGFRYGSGGPGYNVPSGSIAQPPSVTYTGPAGPISNQPISIKAIDGVWASEFWATSDERTKTNIQEIQDASALSVLRQIRPVTYNYIDIVNKHALTEYGFIAQDVKPVLPYAVTLERDYIPNVYDLADFANSTLTLRNKTTHNIRASDTLKIIDLSQKVITTRISDITDDKNIIVESDLQNVVSQVALTESDKERNLTISTVFVYGSLVNDMNILDKNAIYSVSVGALLQLDKIQAQQQATIANLMSEVSSLTTVINELKTKIV